MWCYRRALRIRYVDHVSNDEVLKQVSQSRLLLEKTKSQKLRYFGHVARHPSLQNSITLGFMPGTRRQGGQRRQWTDDITDWAGLNLPEVMTLANERRQYRQLVRKIVKASRGVWLGTNLIHGEKCVISRDVSENTSNFMENSRKEFRKFTENSRAPQTLFRGAMLMQTKKSVE